MLRIRIDSSGTYSPALPTSVDRAFQPLVSGDAAGKIDKAGLASLPAPDTTDSNETEIREDDGYTVVADGTDALRLVVDGLQRRLAHRIEPDERLVLAGDGQ